MIINKFTSKNPTCAIDNYEFKASHQLSLGTQLFDANEINAVPMLIGSSSKKTCFTLSKIVCPEGDNTKKVNDIEKSPED